MTCFNHVKPTLIQYFTTVVFLTKIHILFLWTLMTTGEYFKIQILDKNNYSAFIASFFTLGSLCLGMATRRHPALNQNLKVGGGVLLCGELYAGCCIRCVEVQVGFDGPCGLAVPEWELWTHIFPQNI